VSRTIHTPIAELKYVEFRVQDAKVAHWKVLGDLIEPNTYDFPKTIYPRQTRRAINLDASQGETRKIPSIIHLDLIKDFFQSQNIYNVQSPD